MWDIASTPQGQPSTYVHITTDVLICWFKRFRLFKIVSSLLTMHRWGVSWWSQSNLKVSGELKVKKKDVLFLVEMCTHTTRCHYVLHAGPSRPKFPFQWNITCFTKSSQSHSVTYLHSAFFAAWTTMFWMICITSTGQTLCKPRCVQTYKVGLGA